jgi:hypothetical protein
MEYQSKRPPVRDANMQTKARDDPTARSFLNIWSVIKATAVGPSPNPIIVVVKT